MSSTSRRVGGRRVGIWGREDLGGPVVCQGVDGPLQIGVPLASGVFVPVAGVFRVYPDEASAEAAAAASAEAAATTTPWGLCLPAATIEVTPVPKPFRSLDQVC